MGAEVLIGAANDRAFQRTAGIALGRHDHADHRLGLEGRRRQARHVAARAPQQIGHDVAGEPHHQHLAFRVAEAGVELDHLGAFVGRHQSGVEHAAIGGALLGHVADGRLDDQFVGLPYQIGCEDGRGRIGAHAAGVRPQIAVEGALVVLGAPEQQGLLSIAQGEQRAFLAVHELLDHDAGAGRAEPAAQHSLDLGLSVRAVGADGHALAGGQTVGLDDIGGTEGVQRRLGVRDRLMDAVARRGDAVPRQERLGEGLGRLQLRGLGRGSETGDARRGQTVGQAGGQRHLRPHHHQIGADFAGQGRQPLGVVGLDGAKLAQLLDARIAGRGDQAFDQRRLGDLPGQGVFAAARSDEKNVHETGQ